MEGWRRGERRGGLSRWRQKVQVRIQTVTKQTHNKHGMEQKLPTPQPNTIYDLVKFLWLEQENSDSKLNKF